MIKAIDIVEINIWAKWKQGKVKDIFGGNKLLMLQVLHKIVTANWEISTRIEWMISISGAIWVIEGNCKVKFTKKNGAKGM